jgi:DNA-binding CsgD family transcriptional regulator
MRVIATVVGQLAQPSRRECEVGRLLAHGGTNKAIAFELGISIHAVKKHIAHMRATLSLKNRAQLAVWIVSHPECVEGVAVPLAFALPFPTLPQATMRPAMPL